MQTAACREIARNGPGWTLGQGCEGNEKNCLMVPGACLGLVKLVAKSERRGSRELVVRGEHSVIDCLLVQVRVA